MVGGIEKKSIYTLCFCFLPRGTNGCAAGGRWTAWYLEGEKRGAAVIIYNWGGNRYRSRRIHKQLTRSRRGRWRELIWYLPTRAHTHREAPQRVGTCPAPEQGKTPGSELCVLQEISLMPH